MFMMAPFLSYRFPFWGSPSLRQAAHGRRADRILRPSLPLLGKPFIEASATRAAPTAPAGSLPLLGKPFIEADFDATDLEGQKIASPSGEALH